jgi:hypothetical protein
MKIWFDVKQADFKNFKAEKLLLIPFIEKNIIESNNEFKDDTELKDIIIEYTEQPSEADVLVYHDKLDHNIAPYIDIAKTYNKKVLAFYNDDKSAPTALPECVHVYRTSIIKEKRKSNEFSLPAWSCDFKKIIAPNNIKTKNKKPIIGFCGALTHPTRFMSLQHLQQNDSIQSNFIIRNSFWGGSIHNEQLRREYIQNMYTSDMILCCRGEGNFSYRLYETMSVGKIPIIIDTELVLPCEDVINWKEISVWVSDINDINTNIKTFWDRLTDKGYIALQNLILEVYNNYICPSGFAKYLETKYSK